MENYREMHYSAYLQSDYHKYKNLFRKVLKYEYNPIVKYEILTIREGKTEEDVKKIERELNEQRKNKRNKDEQDEGDYFAHYYE